MLNILVMVSGGGTNLQAIIDGIKNNTITNTKIKAVRREKMKLFREAIIIFGIYLLGVLIADITRVPIPGNVIGMLILFLLLWS